MGPRRRQLQPRSLGKAPKQYIELQLSYLRARAKELHRPTLCGNRDESVDYYVDTTVEVQRDRQRKAYCEAYGYHNASERGDVFEAFGYLTVEC